MHSQNKYNSSRDEILNIISNDELSLSEKFDKLNLTELIQTTDIYQAELLAQNQELIDKEEELVASRNEFETLYNLAPIAYLELDIDFNIIKYNNFAMKFFRHLNLSIIKNKSFSFLIHSSDIISFIYLQKKLEIEHYANSVLNFSIKGELFGRVDIVKHNKNYFVSIVDITNERKQEALILAQAKKAAMGEMVSMITHQWKQPLSVISILNTTMDFSLKEGDFDKENFLNYNIQIKEQIDYMAETIDDFKDYFKDDHIKQIVNVQNCIDKAIKFTSAALKKHDIKLQLNYLDDGDYRILAFRNDVCQTLMNIINNAKDALSEIKDQRVKKISLNVYHQDSKVVFKIENNGGMIPLEVLSSIFDQTYSTKLASGGSGIGLYIVEKIVKEHLGGTVEVSNIEEKDGVAFIIKVPLYKEV